jgi:rhodanese-related sulfurtransferase
VADIVFYSLLALIVIWFFYARFAGIKGLSELDSTTFQQAIADSKSNVLIDVREPSEVKQGKIPGAVNIPLGQLSSRLQEIPQAKSIHLYCRSGMRSRQAAKILLANGFAQVAHLKGGIMSWSGEIK